MYVEGREEGREEKERERERVRDCVMYVIWSAALKGAHILPSV